MNLMFSILCVMAMAVIIGNLIGQIRDGIRVREYRGHLNNLRFWNQIYRVGLERQEMQLRIARLCRRSLICRGPFINWGEKKELITRRTQNEIYMRKQLQRHLVWLHGKG